MGSVWASLFCSYNVSWTLSVSRSEGWLEGSQTVHTSPMCRKSDVTPYEFIDDSVIRTQSDNPTNTFPNRNRGSFLLGERGYIGL